MNLCFDKLIRQRSLTKMHLPSFNQLCDSALNCSEFKELFSVAASSLSLAMLCGLPLNIFECGTVCMFVHY